jgi:2-polyprenyl-6-methoxyphenol hydroxylase-like FAD-dependent oxidoreductase
MVEKKKLVAVDGLGGGGKDDVVGWSGNLSGTYWVVVIRPEVSRTATASMWNTSDRPIAILDRPKYRISLVCSILLHDAQKDACKHVKNTLSLLSRRCDPCAETGASVFERPNTT